MTGAEFSEVDIDLLADYVGGALDGTPDEALVTRRIAADPAWQDAFVELTNGAETVSGALRAWGAEPEPMPADIVARLDAALLAPGADASTAPPAAEPAGAAPVRHLVSVPSGSARPTTARRLKWAAPIGIAAAVLAFAGFGIQQLAVSDSSDSEATSAAGSAPEPMIAAPLRTLESGADYTEQSLGQMARKAETDLSAPEGTTANKSVPSASVLLEDALTPLRVQEALAACLDAIAAENGTPTITAQTVDYARFQGSAAVVVAFTAANGAWVWAVGPACGSPGSGAARLGSLRVG
ncbi:hypothetical protein [Actinoplanes sp. NPDC051494]|uniref:hypothetical protein n=1 Tax=Actinoplanes sp. NPDC051494 TaxID=3363907 RepID=UPI003788B994